LYACSALAEVYDPIATELYNLAFVSCWKILNDKQKEFIITSLYCAIDSQTAPTIILQTVLNLAEFMEHDENTLPLETSTLGSLAEKCNAYAKALYYREIEFEANPINTIESLISINYGLQQPEAAMGILIYAQKNLQIELKEDWYQKLHRWEDALLSYRMKQLKNPDSQEIIIGKLQCFKALSDWDNLAHISQEIWTNSHSHSFSKEATENIKTNIAELSACAALNLGQWENLQQYVQYIQQPTYEKIFYQCLLAIHAGNFEHAQELIDKYTSFYLNL
jgi:serine/threonine-protein kinase mTOR